MGNIQGHFSRKLISLDAMKTCQDAAGLMHEHHIGAVAVTQRGRPVGLVSERSLAMHVVRTGGPPSMPLGEIVARAMPTVSPAASEQDCAEIMRAHRCRHLLVEEGGEVVGVVSMRDVIALMLDEKEHMINMLDGYIRRA